MNKHDFDAPMISHGGAHGAFGGVDVSKPAADMADAQPDLPRRAAWLDDGTVRLDLRKAIAQKSTGPAGDIEVVVDHVILHPLTGVDVMRAQASKGGIAGSMNTLIQTSARQFGPIGEDLLRRMDARDYLALATIVGVFTDPGR